MGNFSYTKKRRVKPFETNYGLIGKISRYLNAVCIRRATTVAGGASFFAVLGFVPFMFATAWVLSVLKVDYVKFLSDSPFNLFPDLNAYVLNLSYSVDNKVTLVFIATAVYSSSKLFYHLKRSGELIYGEHRRKSGLRLKLSSVLMTVLSVSYIALSVAVVYIVNGVFVRLGIYVFAKICSVILTVTLITAYVVILNYYVCPYKIMFYEVIKGSVVTVIFSVVAVWFFSFYVENYSAYDKLYGALSLIVVFLLVVYLVMQGFVFGVLLNAVGMTEVKRPKTVF